MNYKSSLFLVLTFIITSCGGGGGGGGSSTPTPPTPPANNAPTFANVGTIGVAENTTAIGTVTATDADGDTLTYSVTGDDASSVSIGSGTGVLAFNTAPDFENPGSASGDNNYSITVVASDGSATGSVAVVVSVTDVDENTNSAPAFTSPASYSVNENTTAIGTVSATDADNDTLTFSVSGTDSNLVSIDASSGELIFNTAPDYENPIDSGSDNTYVISIAANDGTTSTTQSITVTVADVDEDSSTNATDIFISEYAEGSSNNKYIEIFNATGAEVSLNNYGLPSVGNAPTTAGEYEFWNGDIFGANDSIADGNTYVVCHPQADQVILDKCDATHQYLSNGNDGYALVKGTESDYVVVDWLGNFDGDPGDGWDVCGITEATKDHTLIKKDGAEGNSDWADSSGTNSDDCDWIVNDKDDWNDLGVHTWNGSSNGIWILWTIILDVCRYRFTSIYW